MSNKRLTDFATKNVPTVDDWVYCVDVADTTESPLGSSKKVKAGSFPNPAVINVKDYGSLGGVDDSAAFTNAFAALVATAVALSPDPYIRATLLIPQGTYNVATSINWTGSANINISIQGYGAVLVGKVAGGNVIDMTGTLGAHVKGLTVVGDSVSPPKTGLLIGPVLTNTSGINSFVDCKFIGHFSVAPFWNHGSETTEHNGCRFSNSYPAAETYSYLGDGLNRFNAISAYRSIRAVGTAVSFTANSFRHCSFRNWATNSVGGSVYIEGTNSWLFDKTCYFLAFIGASVRIRNEAVNRTVGLSLAGLFETSQAPGLNYCVEYLLSDGVATGTFDNNFDFTAPLANGSVIKVTKPGGGATTGTIVFTGTVKLSSPSIGGVKLFDAPTMTYVGDINCRTASSINLNFIDALSGVLYVDNKNSLVIPASIDTHNLVVFDSTSGNIAFHSNKPVFHCMNNSDVAGGLVFSRSIGQADRSSELQVLNSPTPAVNYLKLLVHNGTVGTKYATLSAFGDGRVQVGDSAVSNILRIEPNVAGTGDVVVKAFGFATNINLGIQAKGTGTIVFLLSSVPNYANDAAAQAGGVAIGGMYRNGSALQIRVA